MDDALRTRLYMANMVEIRRKFAMHAPPVPDWYAPAGKTVLERTASWPWFWADSVLEQETKQVGSVTKAGGAD